MRALFFLTIYDILGRGGGCFPRWQLRSTPTVLVWPSCVSPCMLMTCDNDRNCTFYDSLDTHPSRIQAVVHVVGKDILLRVLSVNLFQRSPFLSPSPPPLATCK